MCVSSMKPFIRLFSKHLVSVYYAPGVTEVLVSMTNEFSPPGVYLLVRQPGKGQANECDPFRLYFLGFLTLPPT